MYADAATLQALGGAQALQLPPPGFGHERFFWFEDDRPGELIQHIFEVKEGMRFSAVRDIACELLSCGIENTQLTTASGEIWDLDSMVADFPNCCIVLAWDDGEQESWCELFASELGLWITASCLSLPLAPLRLSQAVRQGTSQGGAGVGGWLNTTYRIYSSSGFAALWSGAGLAFLLDFFHAFPLLMDTCKATILSSSLNISYTSANVSLGLLSTLSLPISIALRKIQISSSPNSASLYENIFAAPSRAEIPGIVRASVPLMFFDAVCIIIKRPLDTYLSAWLDKLWNTQGLVVNVLALFSVRMAFLPLRVVYTHLMLGDVPAESSWSLVGPFISIVKKDGLGALFYGATEELLYTAIQTCLWPPLYYAFTNSFHQLRKRHGRRQGAIILLKYELMLLGTVAGALYWQHRRVYPRIR